MPGVPGAPRAEGANNEEEVAQDGDHNGDHVESDPAPLVLLVNNVGAGQDQAHIFTDRGEGLGGEGVVGRHHSLQLSTVGVEDLWDWRGVHVELTLLAHLDLRLLSITFCQI